MAHIFLPFQVILGNKSDNTCKVKRCYTVWQGLKYRNLENRKINITVNFQKKLEWRKLHLACDLKDGLT